MSQQLLCALFAIVFMITLAAPGDSFAVVPEQGQEYPGGTVLEFPTLGITLSVPAGWVAGIPLGGEVLMMAKQGLDGQIVVAADKIDTAEVKNRLSQGMPIAEGVALTPTAKPTGTGNRLTNTYQMNLHGTAFEGLAFGLTGKHGVSVIGIGIFTEPAASEVKQALAAVEKSLKLTALVAPPPAPPALPGGLAGQRLRRFVNQGGYSSEEQFFFCSDGTFARSFSGGGVSGDFSMASQSGGMGRWKIQGNTINLHWQDGTTGALTMQRVDGKLMINGVRWFVDNQTRCP